MDRDIDDYTRMETRILEILDDLSSGERRPTTDLGKKYENASIKGMWIDLHIDGSWKGFVDFLKQKQSRVCDFILDEDIR